MSIVRLDDLTSTAGSFTDAGPPRSIARPIAPMLVTESLRLYDLLVVGLTGVVAYLVYVVPEPWPIDDRYHGSIVLGTTAAAAIFQRLGAYRSDVAFTKGLGARRVASAWLLTFALLLTAVFALKITEYYSRVWAVSWFGATLLLLMSGRLVLSSLTYSWARQHRFANRALIVGVGEQGQRLAEHLRGRGDARTRIVGFIDDRGGQQSSRAYPAIGVRHHPVLGNVDRMMELIRQNLIDEVIIALPWSEEERVRNLTMQLATTPVRIRLAPGLVGFHFTDRKFQMLAGLPTLKLFDRPISGWSRVAKTVEDQLIAFVALVLAAPLMLAISLLIRHDSPGPVFFRQKRYGFNDNLIEILKFRTMRAECSDADADIQTTRDDPRVTRIGCLLRKTSLDELPQLINVLRGEMSIVGPRPHAIATKAEGRLFQDLVDGYAARHRVKPGITGWAQVNGWRGETDTAEKIRKRVECDLYYIDNWSVWLDLVIILRTALAVLRPRNAY